MWYLSLLFILFLIIIFTYFVKEYRRYRLELDKTLLEYHSYVVKMDKLEKENIQLRRELAIEKNAAKEIVVQQKEVKKAASEFAIVQNCEDVFDADTSKK